jgi:hypothetical protein
VPLIIGWTLWCWLAIPFGIVCAVCVIIGLNM